jgi:simple sugar transport system substrate-binding protein
VLRNINAYTLGARSVDPSITTQVIFTGEWSQPVKEAEATNTLIDQGADAITCHVDSPKVVMETIERRGVFACGYHANQAPLAPKGYLTGAEWNWKKVYTDFVTAAQAGKPLDNFVRGGLKDGFVKTSAYGPAVGAEARAKADAIKAQMMGAGYDIFKGSMKNNKGAEVIAAGKSYGQTDLWLEQMDWLVEGVHGSTS